MALVQMKCPNCGGQMQPQGGAMSFKCPHCGTTVLNIVEAKLDSDVTIMTPEEFEQKANENRKSLVVKFDDRLEEIDVDTTVINKAISDAKKWLDNSGDSSHNILVWGKVENALAELYVVDKKKWEHIPAINRLYFLLKHRVRDESEMLIRSVDIRNDPYYLEIINSPDCDPQTKDTYKIMAKECLNNLEIDKEIDEGYKLIHVKASEQFTTYAKAMCNKYPFKIKSWLMLAEAYKGNKKKIKQIYGIMQKCPDFKLCQDYVTSEWRKGEFSDEVAFRIPVSLNNYIYERKVNTVKGNLGTFFGLFAIVVALGAIIAAFQFVGSFRDDHPFLYAVVCFLVIAAAGIYEVWLWDCGIRDSTKRSIRLPKAVIFLFMLLMLVVPLFAVYSCIWLQPM